MTFYDPGNPVARESAASARAAAQQLGIEFVERQVRSVEELRLGLQTLKTEEADAVFLVSDGMVISQAQLVADAAKAKKLPTMFNERSIVVGGEGARELWRELLYSRPAGGEVCPSSALGRESRRPAG